jgi:hypothetical protein
MTIEDRAMTKNERAGADNGDIHAAGRESRTASLDPDDFNDMEPIGRTSGWLLAHPLPNAGDGVDLLTRDDEPPGGGRTDDSPQPRDLRSLAAVPAWSDSRHGTRYSGAFERGRLRGTDDLEPLRNA